MLDIWNDDLASTEQENDFTALIPATSVSALDQYLHHLSRNTRWSILQPCLTLLLLGDGLSFLAKLNSHTDTGFCRANNADFDTDILEQIRDTPSHGFSHLSTLSITGHSGTNRKISISPTTRVKEGKLCVLSKRVEVIRPNLQRRLSIKLTECCPNRLA